MGRKLLSVASMLVTALVVVGLVLALGACGGGGGAGGAEHQQQAKARPLPEAGKALRPGEYCSTEFKPSLTFRVGKGW